MRQFFLVLLFQFAGVVGFGQTANLQGQILDGVEGTPLPFANISLDNSELGTTADENGFFILKNVPAGKQKILVSYLGYEPHVLRIFFEEGELKKLEIDLKPTYEDFQEVVITGTMKEVNRLESPVPVEVYNPVFFKKNPTPNIYEALQNVNGVRPQMNCQVCNTGDIHINGLEGPYTMVLIDGMPIVSSLATVYGLFGIPNSIIERTEIVKGPASSLYGSEAIGGLINIITKSPEQAPLLSADIMATSWAEYNADLGLRFNVGKGASVLTGINYFNYDKPFDYNGDNFTDITLVERASVFQKWSFQRKNNRLFTLAGRYYWEDRWGGEMNWSPKFRGGDEVYGEAITTNRWELLGQYELPTAEPLLFSFSLNGHDQNSVYGDMPYLGQQNIAFGQLTWDKRIGKHDFLLGSALRYTFYDDNTPATGGEQSSPTNDPDETWLPGVFIQDEILLDERHKLLLGLRYDYNQDHGNILTPRFAYKWSISPKDIFRLNVGTGFRVVNLFTEDHASLTGAREVVITEALDPERSYNINANYIKKIYFENGGMASIDFSAWYTHFTNAIFPDYETNSNQIIYDNLDGYAVTQGLSINGDLELPAGFSFLLGATLMDVTSTENGIRQRQILTERFTGTWSASYRFAQNKLSLDYTGNLYGPMRLPLLGELDPRPEHSPWWSIQNIQLTYKGLPKVEIYGGVKNLLNWTPWKNQEEPIIARSFDPFDRAVDFDSQGNIIPSPNNPHALSFDPSYVYAPNQGIRGFLGIRYQFD